MSADRSEFHFHFPIRVRYNEVDNQSIVFNSRYLEYCDAAFTEYFRAAGISPLAMLPDFQFNPVVVRAELDFVSPARVDDLLEAHVRVVKIGRSSLVMETALYQHATDTLICRVQNTYVNVDQATNQPTPVGEGIRAAIARAEAAALP